MPCYAPSPLLHTIDRHSIQSKDSIDPIDLERHTHTTITTMSGSRRAGNVLLAAFLLLACVLAVARGAAARSVPGDAVTGRRQRILSGTRRFQTTRRAAAEGDADDVDVAAMRVRRRLEADAEKDELPEEDFDEEEEEDEELFDDDDEDFSFDEDEEDFEELVPLGAEMEGFDEEELEELAEELGMVMDGGEVVVIDADASDEEVSQSGRQCVYVCMYAVSQSVSQCVYTAMLSVGHFASHQPYSDMFTNRSRKPWRRRGRRRRRRSRSSRRSASLRQ